MTVSSIILSCKVCKKFCCSLDTNSLSLVSSNEIATMLINFMKTQNISVICPNCQECQEHEFEQLEDLR
jgi:hypothetical protein